MDLASFLARLSGVITRNGYNLAKCPAHDDHKQSLSVSVSADGTILLRDHAGCSARAVCDALHIPMSDLFADAPDKRRRAPVNRPVLVPPRREVATYDYADESGTLLYQSVRYEPKDFRQRQPDGTGWLWTVKGVRHVLYRLDDLAALRPASVVVVEGEKDADALWALGIRATTSVAGAGKWPGHGYPAQLTAAGVREVVVVPDNDAPGREHMRDVAEECAAAGLGVRWLELDVPVKGDVSDWLAAGGTPEALRALLAGAKPWPFRTTLQDVHDVFRKWLGEEFDLFVVDAVLAAAASEKLAGDPVWMLVVAGAGAGKTETVSALEGAGGIVVSMISSPAALLSASPARERTKESTGGLLRRMGERGLLVVKDLTTILSMDKTSRAMIVSALREIYDGKWSREVGTEGGRVLEWRGRIVVIGATTTEWDTAHQVVAACGDRFLLVRMDTALGRRGSFYQAFGNLGHETPMRRELSESVGQLLAGVPAESSVTMGDAEIEDLYQLSEALSWSRSAVRVDYRDEVVSSHSPEKPPRVGKQLYQLIRGACALGLSLPQAMTLAARCAHDSIHPTRLALLRDLWTHPESNVAKIAKRVSLPYNTAKRELEGMWTQGIASREEVRDDARPHGEYAYSLTSRVNLAIFQKFSIAPNSEHIREPGDESEPAPIAPNTKTPGRQSTPF